MAFEVPLWRALAVYRVAALIYSGMVTAVNLPGYAHPVLTGVVLGVMVCWTVTAIYLYADPARRGWPLLTMDLSITGACLLASGWVVRPGGLDFYDPTVTGLWAGAPVLAWAVSGGRRRGAVAAVLLGAMDIAVRGGPDLRSLNGTALMLLAGVVVGHVTRLAFDAEDRLQRAAQAQAAIRERERLARSIHDSVLQVLALVQRRGAELGGEAAELGRLAGEQERALRSLVSTGTFQHVESGMADLRAVLSRYASDTVTIVTPADPVRLDTRRADEVAAAVGSALDNVARHCPPGTRTWVLVETEASQLVVTVRDDGPGIADGRLAAARRAGRLGIAQSVRGRIHDLGGTVKITTGPQLGTEVELRIPNAAPVGPAPGI